MAEPSDQPKMFEEIKREVIESRNMTIKTDNALKTLSAELKAVAAQQAAFHARAQFASGVAYVLFTALCVAGVAVITNVRASSANAERERLEKQVAELGTGIDRLRGEQAAQQAAEQGATQAYKMLSTFQGEERMKGVEAMARLDQSRLSPFTRLVLQERAAMVRKDVGQTFLEKGKTAFRRNEFQEAVAQLTRFLAVGPSDEEAAEGAYFLGSALMQLRKFDEAIKPLTRFVEQDKRAKARDYAMLLLMQAYDMVGKRDEALAVAKEASASYPASEYRGQFALRVQRPGTVAVAVPAAGVLAPVVPSPTPAGAPVGPAPSAPVLPRAPVVGATVQVDAGVAPAWKPSVAPLPAPDARPPAPGAPGR